MASKNTICRVDRQQPSRVEIVDYPDALESR